MRKLTRKGKRIHPLLLCLANRVDDVSKVYVAHVLGITPQALYIFLSKVRKQPETPMPARWARPLAKLFGVRPAYFRPDLYAPHWEERRNLL